MISAIGSRALPVTTEDRVHHLFEKHFAERPYTVAVRTRSGDITFGELAQRTRDAAAGLHARGIGDGDRVAVFAKNNAAFVTIFLACSRLGVVLVTLNARLAAEEARFILRDSGSRLLFTDLNCAETATAAIVGTAVEAVLLMAETGAIQDFRSDPAATEPKRRDTPDPILIQMYTSGTSGTPKGALLTQSNLVTLARNGVAQLGPFSTESISLVCMPLFHIGGIDWLLFSGLAGCRIVLTEDIQPGPLMASIIEEGVTCGLLVPTIIRMLVGEAEERGLTAPALHTLVFGASPMPTDLLRRAQRVFPNARCIHVYGLTETSGMFVSMPVDPAKLESCGRPWPDAVIRILGESGTSQPANAVGEIVCRTPQLLQGYWNRPAAAAETLRDGWFHTGDAGFFDEDGCLFIKDRLKDMIKTGGENVYPAEVEEVLSSHPAVREVAVFGLPDPRWDEIVVAAVLLRPGHDPGPAELANFARARLAGFKLPKRFCFPEDLPRNATGKVLKYALRASFAEELPA